MVSLNTSLAYPTTDLLVLQSSLEKSEKRSQAETVHVINLGQVRDDEVHLAGTLSQRQIGVPLL